MGRAYDLRKNATPDPARVAACVHRGLYWYASPHDERGWYCVDCQFSPGEEPGYSPQHDRDLLHTKVSCILHDLVDAELVSVSNGSHGESIEAEAVRICRDQKTLDSESIAAVLTRICAGDGAYWRKHHEAILAGKDERERCHCGKLAHCFTGGKSYCSFDCQPKRDGNTPW